MSNWTTSKLSDVIEIIGGGTPKRSENKYWNGDIPWLSVADFNNDFRYVNDSIEHITELGLQKSSTKLLDKDHLIISARGTVGCLAQLSVPMAFNQSCYGLNGKEGIIDNGFLYYFLKNNISELKQKTHGAVFDTITRDTFEHIQISYPDLGTQKEIAKNLGSFDDKIQLNTQINQTLEQIAQALFKSWFVDFDPVRAKVQALSDGMSLEQAELAAMQAISGKTPGELTALSQTQPDRYAELAETAKAFPCEMVEVDGVEVPKGWEYCTFGDVAECFDSKRIPLSKQQREKRKGDISYYGATSVMDYVNEAIFDDIYLLIGEDGSVLKEDGTPFTQYIWGKSWVNNHAHVIKGKNGVSTEHLMLFIQQTNITAYITGAVQLKLNQKNMNSIPFIKASNKTNLIFAQYIAPLYAKIRKNFDENKILETTRDLLLPRLLNGEI